MIDLFDMDRKFHPMDTSVAEAMQDIRKATSLADLRDWLAHERRRGGRTTIINAISARIRKIEKGVNNG